MPAAVLLRTRHSHLYPGSIVTLDHDAPRTAKPHPAVIEFADGSGATATLSRVGDDTLELAVDEYVTQKRHAIVARPRDRRAPLVAAAARCGPHGMAHHAPASCHLMPWRRYRREPLPGAKIRRLGIHDEQAF
ncbi:hypothetical protein QZM43_27205 [Burkholderia orbicola]|nr:MULTISPECIES: hypothetical protein [Burkholderia cepacia complex]MDN7472250.1 hypothetical protein [Burkholderia orbicola]MDN7506425.1 hypothetical protein [Burkholderia orbicola]